MPSVVSSTVPPPAVSKAAAQKPQPAQHPRKKRIVRRRGRAQNGIESDDEIEREVASDSEFDDDDDSSSLDSATDDSDTEPASEDAPSHLESPPATAVVGVAGETHMNGGVAPFFASTSTWSEMVAEEATNGTSGLPVIDFSEFDTPAKVPARRAKKAQKQKKQQQAAATASGPTTEQQAAAEQEDKSAPRPTSASLPRKLGQTARQAYQERLESDPSYVPKVGGFWGHDDRLMDKDLRSLSGWWRGKWSGRGRGRGFGMRGARGDQGGHEVNPEDLPPVERPWTHDGFEEMKRKEEQRQQAMASRGRGGFRGGRGAFSGRGRGGFGRNSPASSGRPNSPATHQPRVWWPQKPELTWSKQSEAFLFYDGSYKPRAGGGLRVKLPGKESKIAKVTKPIDARSLLPVSQHSASTSERPKEFQYTVRLPKPKEEQSDSKSADAATTSSQSQLTEAQPVTEDTQPAPCTAPAKPLEEPVNGLPDPSVVAQLEQLSLESTVPDPERLAKTEEAVLRNAGSEATTEHPDGVPGDQRPVLPPLQTVFTPPPPPPPPVPQSPPYGSPYMYPQALPPGIAINHQGMPYEVATGRPVYLQPPPPMYNPRPMHYPPPGVFMHGPPVPHPHAVSPDYLSQPASHTPPMNGFVDPNTGAPIFSLPRSVRIEIRAPDEARNNASDDKTATSPPAINGVVKPPSHNRTPSKLRTGAVSFEPSRPQANGAGEYYSSSSEGNGQHPSSYEATNGVENGASDGAPLQQHQHQPHMGNMMPYPAYQPPYYYPDHSYGHGYPGYMDMSQVGQYDPYNMDHQPQQGTVYY
ncbi:hypothetical protein CC2G_010142 [Coprinopsis cinerea AmutBmut pab1-1]|nr:hypothetical protein CC2G_010142 [Coprinopsis cinerea AmutBmut pab1-1]